MAILLMIFVMFAMIQFGQATESSNKSYIIVKIEQTWTDDNNSVFRRLEKNVLEKMMEGYVPLGGPQCITVGQFKCWQAMVQAKKTGSEVTEF